MNCEFYILKNEFPTVYSGYRFVADENGKLKFIEDSSYIGSNLIEVNHSSQNSLVQLPIVLNLKSAELVEADKNETVLSVTALGRAGYLKLKPETKYLAIAFQGASFEYLQNNPVCFLGYLAKPHYKKLTLKYSKETNQIFFKKALDGKITLHGSDFKYVINTGLEDKLLFNLYHKNVLVSANWFNKSDCKIDYTKERIELKVTPESVYTNILNAYENTWDLIRCAPAISRLQLANRPVIQVYQEGGNTITSYFAKTYFESEVVESIDDTSALENKYHFSKLRDFTEATLDGFNYKELNTVYVISPDKPEWKGATHTWIENGYEFKGYGVIKLEREASRGDLVGYADPDDDGSGTNSLSTGKKLSDGSSTTVARFVPVGGEDGRSYYEYIYDMYRINIYSYTGRHLYKSQDVYAKTEADYLISGLTEDRYQMNRVETTPNILPSPSYFYLSNFIYTRAVWARMLANVNSYIDSDNNTVKLYDLPHDDMAVTRGNFKKCIGITNLQVWQSSLVQTEPTKYGINDYGEYFSSNFIPTQLSAERPMPVARSNWGNTSLWITESIGYDRLEQSMRKSFILRDAYSIADVLKALLLKIDKNISFEATSEYSSFLYSTSETGSYTLPIGYSIFLAPKSNVLKSDYDQAARKAEITFKDIMEMFRNCFKCYWFIDEQARLRIEHISYFDNQEAPLDLTQKLDSYNKQPILFAQNEVSFDKNDLPARYEFNWMDDSTDLFGNFTLDVNSKYVQPDKHEEIIADLFSSDVDLMMLFPEKFSEDGFALLVASTSNGEVPIINKDNLKDEEFRHPYNATIQNYYASWLYLIRYYMYDMPAKNISYTSIAEGSLSVDNIKRSMTNELICPKGFSINPDRPIITSFGVGVIDNIDIDVDTEQASITLNYQPK